MSQIDELEQLVTVIATQLGETRRGPLAQIRRIVRLLGAERATALLMRALEAEAMGGLLVPDGSRRRTPGGVFFHLVKQEPGATRSRRQKARERRTGRPREPHTPTAIWTTRRTIVQPALAERGVVEDVKITLVGRPGALVRRQGCIILAMEQARGPSLPRGLPPVPESATTYTVYVAQKDWPAVDVVVADPEAALVVDGWAAYDPELEGIAVFAMRVTTRRVGGNASDAGGGA